MWVCKGCWRPSRRKLSHGLGRLIPSLGKWLGREDMERLVIQTGPRASGFLTVSRQLWPLSESTGSEGGRPNLTPRDVTGGGRSPPFSTQNTEILKVSPAGPTHPPNSGGEGRGQNWESSVDHLALTHPFFLRGFLIIESMRGIEDRPKDRNREKYVY